MNKPSRIDIRLQVDDQSKLAKIRGYQNFVKENYSLDISTRDAIMSLIELGLATIEQKKQDIAELV
jgi:hypothetical protein